MKRKFFVFSILMVMISSVSFAADLLSLVPYDSILVFSVDLDKISSQPVLKGFVDKNFPNLDNEENIGDFAKLGINPTKDFKKVILFISGDEKCGLIAEGTFDTISTCDAVEGDKEIQKYYTMSSVGGLSALYNENVEQATITLVDQHTLALGDMSILEEIGKLYNEKENGKSIKKNPNFIYMSNRLDLDKQIWGVGIGGKGWNSNIKAQKSGIDKVRMTFFDVDYGDKDFNLSITALVAKNSELEGLVKSLVELVEGTRHFVSTVPGMTKIVDKVEIVDDHSNMARIQLNMPIDQFNAALSEVAGFVEQEEK